MRLAKLSLAGHLVTQPSRDFGALEMDERFPGLRAAVAADRERLVEELLDRVARRRSFALEEGASESHRGHPLRHLGFGPARDVECLLGVRACHADVTETEVSGGQAR